MLTNAILTKVLIQKFVSDVNWYPTALSSSVKLHFILASNCGVTYRYNVLTKTILVGGSFVKFHTWPYDGHVILGYVYRRESITLDEINERYLRYDDDEKIEFGLFDV